MNEVGAEVGGPTGAPESEGRRASLAQKAPFPLSTPEKGMALTEEEISAAHKGVFFLCCFVLLFAFFFERYLHRSYQIQRR